MNGQIVTRLESEPSLVTRSIGAVMGRLGFVGAVCAFVGTACACETPVYRYAMYRWTPMAYDAFFFHRGPISPADQSVHAALAERDKEGIAPNLAVRTVDVGRPEALQSVPESVRKIWQAESDKPLPRYVFVTPWGDVVYTGQIDVAAARNIVESPVRAEIGQNFQQGHGIVLLILEGDNPESNARMEAVARKVMSVAEAGKLFSDPVEESDHPPPKNAEAGSAVAGDGTAAPQPVVSPEASQEPETSEPAAPRGVVRVALLKLSRANRDETWLLKYLAAMTPDVQELKPPYEPMLFAIYGRGRVMPPGVGNEVTVETLLGLLRFLGDRCSCTIKDQNPGLDLLMRWDWEATAERFAAEEEASFGPPLYAEMPADGNASPSTRNDDAPTLDNAAASVASSAATRENAQAVLPSEPTGKTTPTMAIAAAAVEGVPPAPERERFSVRQRWQLGFGLAALAVFVVAVGFVVVRRQHHDSP